MIVKHYRIGHTLFAVNAWYRWDQFDPGKWTPGVEIESVRDWGSGELVEWEDFASAMMIYHGYKSPEDVEHEVLADIVKEVEEIYSEAKRRVRA